jgi:4-hydroxyacetophenone monooxygenase
MDLLGQMFERGIGAVEARRDVHDAYNDDLDRTHEQMVWTHPGRTTYYRNRRGRVVVNYPHRNVDLFARTRQADLGDYVTEPMSVRA